MGSGNGYLKWEDQEQGVGGNSSPLLCVCAPASEIRSTLPLHLKVPDPASCNLCDPVFGATSVHYDAVLGPPFIL